METCFSGQPKQALTPLREAVPFPFKGGPPSTGLPESCLKSRSDHGPVTTFDDIGYERKSSTVGAQP